MPQYRIAWLPGDGVGREVLNATRLVLDAIHLDVDYQPGDIGWEFWRREGDAFPARTIDLAAPDLSSLVKTTLSVEI